MVSFSLRFKRLGLQNKRHPAPTFFGVMLSAALVAILSVGMSHPAQALPSFARQTGQPCGTCHTDFPGLTPFGRRFKLLGYTTGGGLYRTTPFSSAPGPNDANAQLRSYAKTIDGSIDAGNSSSGTKGWVPPVSMMAIVGYTHTQVP